MGQAVFTWQEGSELRLAAVPPGTSALIGRSAEAAVRLQVRTVSRQQALVTTFGEPALVQHIGHSNPTLLDGEPLEGAAPLRDGALIAIAGWGLRYHNLAEAFRLVSRTQCSFCERPVQRSDLLCWFCGTTLDNAPVAAVERIPVRCRVVAGDGERWDLCAGERLVLRGDGSALVGGSVREPGALDMVEVGVEGAWLCEVRGHAAVVARRRLQTGDEFRAGGRAFRVILHEPGED